MSSALSVACSKTIGPVSSERRAVQTIGHTQMEQATHWLRMHLIDLRESLNLPTCGDQKTPGGAHGPRVFSCSLEPDHPDTMHLCKEGLSWHT